LKIHLLLRGRFISGACASPLTDSHVHRLSRDGLSFANCH
jgi:hypothetical protein